eukprot:gene4645-14979_t
MAAESTGSNNPAGEESSPDVKKGAFDVSMVTIEFTTDPNFPRRKTSEMFELPSRYTISYTDDDGKKHQGGGLGKGAFGAVIACFDKED